VESIAEVAIVHLHAVAESYWHRGRREVKMTSRDAMKIIGTGGEEEHDVVERHGADEIEQEPRLEVVLRDLTRIENDLVGEIVSDDTCR